MPLAFKLKTTSLAALQAISCVLLLGSATVTLAGEGSKLRQSPVGIFGGEMAAPADNPGFFGTASLSQTRIFKVVDGSGNDITAKAQTIPLPTGVPSGGAIPNGTFTLNVPPGTIAFKQDQTQLNLLGGYLSESMYGNGRLAFAVNVPLITQKRTSVPTFATGTITPSIAGLPAPGQAAVNGVAAAAQAQVQAQAIAQLANQNMSVSGMGDTELSLVWVNHSDRLKIVAGASLFVPTGSYDKTRGPNPGFGNFYTLRPGVAVTYAVNPSQSDEGWDSGVTVGGRVSYGINTTNKETDYRSGDFVYLEGGIVKVKGNWAWGANVLATQQVSDDIGTGVAADGFRYRNYAAGPFLSYKLPGKDAGFNLHYSRNFGSRNALVSETLQLRFIKAW